MKVLVLSCSTGGGHNACAHNIIYGLKEKGIEAVFQNYLELFDRKTQEIVEEFYYKSLIWNGRIFEGIYKLGELYNKTKLTSPVYLLNKRGKDKLDVLIREEGYDLCICTHLYPALALTELKKEKNISFLFVGTDYKCIPFTNEINPDYFVIPSPSLKEDYIRMGIPDTKLLPFGIPVMVPTLKKEDIIEKLAITHSKNIMLMSGSMGFGNLFKVVTDLLDAMDEDCGLYVVCGSNEKLYENLCTISDERLKVLGYIHNVQEYIFVSDVVLTKPGGLSTTEVAILRKPFIHICPIPGVETYNAAYFSQNEMALLETDSKKIATTTIELLKDEALQKKLIQNLEKEISTHSLKTLCTFISRHYQGKEK